ncbi:MAG TPA: 8-amino-7-oxononanoate synthase [Steroidobacteraceae bacterium]|nr:8-amino-7-oxononanoate synthase [Steroidobacteraceae bacterium]
MALRASGLAPYQAALDALTDQSRKRSLAPRVGLDFTSNDYLGLAACARLKAAVTSALARGTPVGAGGSRLLRGNAPEHEALEAKAAAFFRAERTLFFGSGYFANYAVLSTLPQRDDLVVLDALVHASAHEGARAGRAQFTCAAHNDPAAFEKAIQDFRGSGARGRVWMAVESLYSMDGDRAPLDELIALADRHDAMLFIDEAHATGVYGMDGRGLAAELEGRENVLTLHTCGKALGGAGALVAGPRVLCEFLINRCRPFIYSTAPSPLMAAAALEALDILKEEPERRRRLAHLVGAASRAARARGAAHPSGSQILPVIVGEDGRALALATALRERGFDVRAVRPPTVPEGTARLRISVTLNVDEAAIDALFGALAELLAP